MQLSVQTLKKFRFVMHSLSTGACTANIHLRLMSPEAFFSVNKHQQEAVLKCLCDEKRIIINNSLINIGFIFRFDVLMEEKVHFKNSSALYSSSQQLVTSPSVSSPILPLWCTPPLCPSTFPSSSPCWCTYKFTWS